MDEEPFEKTLSEREPEEEGMEQSKEKRNSQSENITEAEPQQEPTALLDSPDANLTSAPVGLSSGEAHEGTKAAAGEPPVDWFEPLEDDDEANNWDFPGRGRHFNGRRDLEEESLAGESDKSWSVASSEKTVRKIYQYNIHSRKRSHPDEGWIEWPMLGEGWKRKEVVRRSGSSVGQKDVYYLSPRGERVRSRVELASVLAGITDLSTFEFKTGTFYNGDAPPPRRVRSKVKRKIRERSSSESSWMERGEGADTPDSHQRLTPNMAHKVGQSNQVGVFSYHVMDNTPNQGPQNEDTLREDKIKLPLTTSSRPLPSINGQIGSEETSLVCARCGISFTGTWYDKQRKKPSCPSCWASKTREHPMIRFRKWIPCGQCVACHNTVDCGQCANCKHGLQTPESRKRVCRKRKCICPIRKSSGSGSVLQQRSHIDIPETFEDNMSFQSEFTDSQHPSYKNSDIEDVNVDVEDDDDMSTDDDDNWHKKRKRRSCGKCTACLCRKDCGTCDFCIDKPKFGGSNKKRQKCRLRQCQRQAMRHLLPFQLGQDEYGTQEGLVPVGRPRPHYTYSRKTSAKKSRGPSAGLDGSDNEDDRNVQATNWSSEPSSGGKHSQNYKKQQSMQVNNSHTGQRNGVAGGVPNLSNNSSSQLVPEQPSRRDGERSDAGRDVEKHTGELEGELPMITQIFSLAKTETPAGSGVDTENQLLKLLESLRASTLPILWYAIVVEGPQLQLIQCAKQSTMTDTIVLIDPGFCYQVTVQKQPLLLTHPLYDDHPPHLTSVTEVVSLLLDLERYGVCQGLPSQKLSSKVGPVILERASTCDFLVKKNVNNCTYCRALHGRVGQIQESSGVI